MFYPAQKQTSQEIVETQMSKQFLLLIKYFIKTFHQSNTRAMLCLLVGLLGFSRVCPGDVYEVSKFHISSVHRKPTYTDVSWFPCLFPLNTSVPTPVWQTIRQKWRFLSRISLVFCPLLQNSKSSGLRCFQFLMPQKKLLWSQRFWSSFKSFMTDFCIT